MSQTPEKRLTDIKRSNDLNDGLLKRGINIMEISSEDYLNVRNDETVHIKDMSIEAIKARILDYEQQLWKIKARQQSCFAVIQEDEKRKSIANEIKNIVSKDVIVPAESIAAKERKEQAKTVTKIERQIEAWKKMQVEEKVIRKMARMIDPTYLFPDEELVTVTTVVCPEHGTMVIDKELLKEYLEAEGPWTCRVVMNSNEVKEKKGTPLLCGKPVTNDAKTEIRIKA